MIQLQPNFKLIFLITGGLLLMSCAKRNIGTHFTYVKQNQHTQSGAQQFRNQHSDSGSFDRALQSFAQNNLRAMEHYASTKAKAEITSQRLTEHVLPRIQATTSLPSVLQSVQSVEVASLTMLAPADTRTDQKRTLAPAIAVSISLFTLAGLSIKLEHSGSITLMTLVASLATGFAGINQVKNAPEKYKGKGWAIFIVTVMISILGLTMLYLGSVGDS